MRNWIIQIKRGSADGHFRRVVAWLEAAGLTVANPLNNAVTFMDMMEADFRETTKERIMAQLASGNPGNVQMWISGDSNSFISWTLAEMRLYLTRADTVDEKRKVLYAVVGGFADICDGLGAGWRICFADGELIEGDDM